MTIKELEKAYKKKQLIWKTSIRMKSSKTKRFFGWLWFLIAFPFVWLFYNIRDWRTAIIFVLVVVVVSIEIWLPLLLAFITWGSDFSKIMLGIAGTCELFWLGPGTPFILLCTFITIAIKGLFNKITAREKKSHNGDINEKNAENSQKCEK